MARHADYARKKLTFSGAAARQVLAFLGLPADRPAALELELPASMEHFSHPQLDASRRDAQGFLSFDPEKKSTLLKNVLSWDPRRGELSIGEHWFAAATGMPREAGPAYRAASPSFTAGRLDNVRGWSAILDALKRERGVESNGYRLRHKDFSGFAEAEQHLQFSLWEPLSGGQMSLWLAAGSWLKAARMNPNLE